MSHEGDPEANKDFEKPKDEFLFLAQVFKTEEKKMIGHIKFEQITAQYWQLLRSMPEQDSAKPTISQKQYTELMRRVYKVLLPLYREQEMDSEIAQEWIMDQRRQPEMSHTTLTKVLFRIAHQWCTNIDIDEYVDLLQRIYQRITFKRAYMCETETLKDYYPKIQIGFPLEEKRINETVVRSGVNGEESQWLECKENEDNQSGYEYKFEEDPDAMIVKKFKRRKAGDAGIDYLAKALQVTIKEPFYFTEDVVYPDLSDYKHTERPDKTLFDAFIDLALVLPFGYPTEQFMRTTKQDVHHRVEEYRQQLRGKKGDDEDNEDKDSGLLPNDSGLFVEIPVHVWGLKQGPSVVARVTDTLYNGYRRQLKDGANLLLRPYTGYPKSIGGRNRGRSTASKDDPNIEINKFGYNPALERRIAYRSLPVASKGGEHQFLNVYYLISDPDFETAYRSDVNRIETKGKMSIKEVDDLKREEEFVNVETSYKKVRQIMLHKKFESIFRDRAQAETAEQRRFQGILDGIEKDKRIVMKPGSISQKGLKETFEEKSFVKMMRGPFCQLDSREGLREDDFYTCAEEDLINAAKTPAMRILVIGKPRAGKSNLAKNLANRIDLVHVSVDNWLAALLAKIKAYEPPEVEEGQEPPKFLSDLEDSVHKALQSGNALSDAQLIEIIRLQIHSPLAVLKGFILDLSFYEREHSDVSWAMIIRQTKLLGETVHGKPVEFTHLIELNMEDEDVRLRAQHMRLDPVDGNVYSRWEREERKKPKPKKEGEEEAEDEENAIKPLDELALLQRVNDSDERIRAELMHYNTVERPALEELLISFHEDQFIRIDAAGLTPEQIADASQIRLKSDENLPLRPLALQIEGAGDFKSLLSEGVEENHLPRKWSVWKQIDPVALFNGKVIQGAAEFACHFHGNVFVFASEENLKAFLAEPKKYLQARPEMPSIFRVLMLGARGSGRHTQAKLLSQIYGWKIVDFKQLIKQRVEALVKQEIHIPNNPLPGGRIGLSEVELNEIIEGKPVPASKFIPWILDFLGHPLEKKKPPPPEEKPEGEVVEEEVDEETKKKREAEAKKKAIEEEKKRKEEEEKEKAKQDRRNRRQQAIEQGLDLHELGLEESDEEHVPLEDLSLDQLVLKVDEHTGKAPFVGGFILVGFPETAEQVEKLKAHGIEFDKIIYLNDTNEEEPGAEIKRRMKETELFDFEQELEAAQKVLGLAKEQLGEENVKEISTNGSEDTVLIRIRNEIDPFYLKVDNPDDVRTSGELGEEDKRLPKGDFGDYCPVTYVRDGWLVRGNMEQEVLVQGKTYWLSGEEEANKFKFNPTEYLKTKTGKATLPLIPPNPKIMVVGHRGAGTTTIIEMLCEKFKLEEFELKKAYLARLKEEKEKRQRARLLNRGFRPPPPVEEEGMEPPPDPEIEEDPEDFDKAGHQLEVFKSLMDASKGYVIDGSWRDIPEGALETPELSDLLLNSRRVPEIVIILKCKQPTTFKRIIDTDKIKAEFDRLMEIRQKKREAERIEKRAAKEEALKAEEEKSAEEKEAEMIKWEEDQDAEEEAADEADPEKPNMEAMLEDQKKALQETHDADTEFIEKFSGALTEKQVFIVDLKADSSADFVFIKLLDRIKDNIAYRKDLIERQLAQPLKPEEVKYYEKSYIYKHSKYGPNSPLALGAPQKTKRNAVLYRERLYFLSNAEEQAKFLKEPSKYTRVPTTPLDIPVKPRVAVLGLPKSGKSTVCKMLADKIGVIHLKMSKIIQSFMDIDSVQGDALRKHMKADGRQLEDDMLVSLILKRVQMKDCTQNGWVLEDFPKTRNQAMFLAKRGIAPTNVLFMKQSVEETYKRTHATADTKFGSNRTILATRIRLFQENTPNLVAFYQRLYNSFVEIDSTKSKWYIEEMALGEVQRNIEARQNFARDYYLRDSGSVCKMRDLHMDACLVKQSLSEFRYYCPVSWRNEKLLVKCNENTQDTVLYNNFFYFFKSTEERDIFVQNPARFVDASSFPRSQDLPFRVMPHKASEVIVHEKTLSGHCSVSLMDEDRVRKGDQTLVVIFKEDKYVFDSEFKLQRFLANPFKYCKAFLPVKMPPPEDKVSLFNLQKMEDSISFMEQALGQVVTRGLREVSENRLKYPTISLKETMLKLFALFLKTENPANTESMKRKYAAKMRQFVQRCELPEELHDLSEEKDKKKPKGHWPEFKENYYNDKGAEYDAILKLIEHEKLENFMNYIR